MQIKSISTENILGARDVRIETSTPITLICGFNGAAKSSIQESIRMALTAETVRVELKKEYASMISDGAKSGSATVITDIGTGTYELPAGKHTLEGELKLGIPDALPYVLNAQAFSSLPEEKRRTFLFGLTNCKVTIDEIRRRLTDKKCNSEKIELVLPMVRSGFPAANKFAAEAATTKRGEWKAVTAETYGSKKGETWEAAVPEVDLERIDVLEAELEAADELMQMRNQQVGAAEQRQKDQMARGQQVKEAQATVANKQRLLDKLAHEESSLASYRDEAANLAEKGGTAPRTGLVHDLAKSLQVFLEDADGSEQPHVINGFSAMEQYKNQYGDIQAGDPDALAKLPAMQKSVTLMETAVANTKRDIAKVHVAEELLSSWESSPIGAENTDIDAIKQSMAELETTRTAIIKELNQLKKLKEQAESAEKLTALAAEHHTAIVEWLAIADFLAPDGIPAEMLAQALKPINTLLRKSSITTGWRQASITPGMQITAEGRSYNLLCESEKWRVDAMIAAAIAELSGIKILMLDRMDVLDINGRAEMLGWIDELAMNGSINTALIFATLKQMPSGLPETINPVWIENGVIADKTAIAA